LSVDFSPRLRWLLETVSAQRRDGKGGEDKKLYMRVFGVGEGSARFVFRK